jgi:hypothetical protein
LTRQQCTPLSQHQRTTSFLCKHGLKLRINQHSMEHMFYNVFMDGLSNSKWCRGCETFLDVAHFSYKYVERGVLQTYCKKCQGRRSREHYVRNTASYKERIARNNTKTRVANRRKLREFLSAQNCVDCGLQDLAVLEFDHREPSQKLHEISLMVQKGFGWTTILGEIRKCDIVCANCHRRRTARQFSWHKVAPRPLALPDLPMRGTAEYERIKSRRSGLARRHRNRRLVWDYLSGHPCAQCGEADPAVLDFDHLGNKLHDIGWLVPATCAARIVAEIEKCRVL